MTIHLTIGDYTLTTEHSASSYGIPVLVGSDNLPLGGDDMMPQSYLRDDLSDIWGPRKAVSAAEYVTQMLHGETDPDRAAFVVAYLRSSSAGLAILAADRRAESWYRAMGR